MTTLPEKFHQLLAAEFKASQAENERLKTIIEAAKKRCGDAKAIHSRLVDGNPMYQVGENAYAQKVTAVKS